MNNEAIKRQAYKSVMESLAPMVKKLINEKFNSDKIRQILKTNPSNLLWYCAKVYDDDRWLGTNIKHANVNDKKHGYLARPYGIDKLTDSDLVCYVSKNDVEIFNDDLFNKLKKVSGDNKIDFSTLEKFISKYWSCGVASGLLKDMFPMSLFLDLKSSDAFLRDGKHDDLNGFVIIAPTGSKKLFDALINHVKRQDNKKHEDGSKNYQWASNEKLQKVYQNLSDEEKEWFDDHKPTSGMMTTNVAFARKKNNIEREGTGWLDTKSDHVFFNSEETMKLLIFKSREDKFKELAKTSEGRTKISTEFEKAFPTLKAWKNKQAASKCAKEIYWFLGLASKG